MGQRLPLVPKPSAIGGLALVLFLMTLVASGMFLSYAGRRMSAEDQYFVLAGTGVLLLVLGGIAWIYFVKPAMRGGE